MKGMVFKSRDTCLRKKISCVALILFRAGYGTSDQQETPLLSNGLLFILFFVFVCTVKATLNIELCIEQTFK